MPRRALLLLLLALPWFAPLSAAEVAPPPNPRVFVCSHSFMSFTARMLPAVAKSAGIGQVDAGEQMLGGSTCIQHWNLPDAQNRAKAALMAGGVDVLMLSPFYLVPDPGIGDFARLGLERNPGLRVFVQASWPAFDSAEYLPRQGVQAERNRATRASLQAMRAMQNGGWRKDLEAQAAALNQEFGRPVVRIIPVNDAVFALRERVIAGTAPGLVQQTDLFKDDIGHPTPPLALLVTYCHFAALHRRTPVGLPVPGSLTQRPQARELATMLQEIAWEAVSAYGSPPPSAP